MQDTSLLFLLTLLVQSLIDHLPEHVGSQILHTQVIASPSPWTLLIQSLSESPNDVKTFFMVRYGQRLHSPLINAMIIIDNDTNCRLIHDLYVTTICDMPTIPFPYVDTRDLSTIRSPMIDNSFLWWSRNDLFSHLRRAVARRLISDYNEQSCAITRNDSQLMILRS
jgi:hypothetical protein